MVFFVSLSCLVGCTIGGIIRNMLAEHNGTMKTAYRAFVLFYLVLELWCCHYKRYVPLP